MALAVYANSLTNGFALDDLQLIPANPSIRSLANLPALFAADYWEPLHRGGLYRPLVITSYAFNYALGGLDPRGYHAINVLLHGLASVLVWGVFRRVRLGRSSALIGALLFAAHALHSEAVANVAGRAELLAACGVLGALWCHVERERSAVQASRRRLYALGLTSFGLALLSKESAVTLVGLLLLHDVAFALGPGRGLGPTLWRVLAARTLPVYAGYLGVALLYLIVRTAALSDGTLLPPPSMIDNPLGELALLPRVVNALQVTGRVAWLLCFPLELSYDYSRHQIPLILSMTSPAAAGVLLLAAASAAAWLWSYGRSRAVFFAVGFMAVSYSLVSNLVLVTGTILGERLLYVPSVGFCMAVAVALSAAAKRLPLADRGRVIALASGALLLVGAHAARTLERNPDWQSGRSLYLADLEEHPRSVKKMNNAAWILIDQEVDVARGIALMERVIRELPEDVEFLDTLAWGYHKLGRHEEARRTLLRSLEISDDNWSAPIRREHLQAVEKALLRPDSGSR